MAARVYDSWPFRYQVNVGIVPSTSSPCFHCLLAWCRQCKSCSAVWQQLQIADAITRTAMLHQTGGSYGHNGPHCPVSSSSVYVLEGDKNEARMEWCFSQMLCQPPAVCSLEAHWVWHPCIWRSLMSFTSLDLFCLFLDLSKFLSS